MSEVDFAWVYQPAVRPGEDESSLIADNDRFIEKLRPYIHALWVEDHFQWEARPMIECWTTLCYLAGKNPDLILAPMVLGQSYRNPALTAKMAATLYYLTGGQMIMGIGAGWKEDEYHSYGWDFPPASTRVEQLEDAIGVIKAMWTQSPANFQGKHYQVANAYCEPRPDPLPPLMIGGAGERLTLRVVAKHADWWNAPGLTLDEFRHKLSVLDSYCRAIGRDPSTIRKTYFGFVSMSYDPARVVHRERDLHVIAGPPPVVIDELKGLAEMGVDYFILRFMDFPAMEGVDLFLSEVLRHFRSTAI